MVDITDRLTAAIAVAIGAGRDIAMMVGSVVNMKNIGGNDDDAKPAPMTRR